MHYYGLQQWQQDVEALLARQPQQITQRFTTTDASRHRLPRLPIRQPTATEAAGGDYADKKVGVCIYQFSDNFMTLFRTELENYLVEQGFSKDNITIVDGANDQATQTGQIDNFISEGVDVLIVNPVNSSSAATITDKVVASRYPARIHQP